MTDPAGAGVRPADESTAQDDAGQTDAGADRLPEAAGDLIAEDDGSGMAGGASGGSGGGSGMPGHPDAAEGTAS